MDDWFEIPLPLSVRLESGERSFNPHPLNEYFLIYLPIPWT